MDKETRTAVGIILVVCVLFVAGVLALLWYKAGVQREVYERQGVHMTQWEVFLGAKPIERLVNIK